MTVYIPRIRNGAQQRWHSGGIGIVCARQNHVSSARLMHEELRVFFRRKDRFATAVRRLERAPLLTTNVRGKNVTMLLTDWSANMVRRLAQTPLLLDAQNAIAKARNQRWKSVEQRGTSLGGTEFGVNGPTGGNGPTGANTLTNAMLTALEDGGANDGANVNDSANINDNTNDDATDDATDTAITVYAPTEYVADLDSVALEDDYFKDRTGQLAPSEYDFKDTNFRDSKIDRAPAPFHGLGSADLDMINAIQDCSAYFGRADVKAESPPRLTERPLRDVLVLKVRLPKYTPRKPGRSGRYQMVFKFAGLYRFLSLGRRLAIVSKGRQDFNGHIREVDFVLHPAPASPDDDVEADAHLTYWYKVFRRPVSEGDYAERDMEAYRRTLTKEQKLTEKQRKKAEAVAKKAESNMEKERKKAELEAKKATHKAEKEAREKEREAARLAEEERRRKQGGF